MYFKFWKITAANPGYYIEQSYVLELKKKKNPSW